MIKFIFWLGEIFRYVFVLDIVVEVLETMIKMFCFDSFRSCDCWNKSGCGARARSMLWSSVNCRLTGSCWESWLGAYVDLGTRELCWVWLCECWLGVYWTRDDIGVLTKGFMGWTVIEIDLWELTGTYVGLGLGALPLTRWRGSWIRDEIVNGSVNLGFGGIDGWRGSVFKCWPRAYVGCDGLGVDWGIIRACRVNCGIWRVVILMSRDTRGC